MHLPLWLRINAAQVTHGSFVLIVAGLLLLFMAALAGGAALRESVTIDEVAHIGAGVSYLQKFDLRLNEEHPPLPKVVAALPLVLRGTHVDYSSVSWSTSREFVPAFLGQWALGEWILKRWNDPATTLAWARLPMLMVTLMLGWIVYQYARRLGGAWGGLLCLSVYVSTPLFLAFGPLVHTDVMVTLFSLLTLWAFADLWQNPTRKNVAMFALSLAGGLLSKFSSGILFFAFGAFALSTRWRAVAGQPTAQPEARAWRRLRWRATIKGVLWAAVFVYAFYFILSLNQTTDVLYRLGHGAAWVPVRRLLMPPWLYLRGMLLLLVTASRPTFILGHAYPHGVWFYFPVLLILKSSLGFLGLLVLALLLALSRKHRDQATLPTIRSEVRLHWRVLWVALLVLVTASVLSRLDIGFRHFSIPLVLLILLLAPLCRMLEQIRPSARSAARIMMAVTMVLALSCLLTALRAYPYYFPYFNALRLGNPTYVLASDSNVDWNQALPEVKRFAEQHGLEKIALDAYGFTDARATVPQSQFWNCQRPTPADDGQWVVVSANMILDTHNCSWLIEYPHEPLAGGSMYAVHLPAYIPAAGSTGGPPRPSEYREFLGFPVDVRPLLLDMIHHPEKIPEVMAAMQAAQTPPKK
jgi:hypothetical protein